MKRREFLRTAGGAAGAATATGAAAAPAAADGGVAALQEDGNASESGGDGPDAGGNETDGGNESTGGGLPGAGETQTITVGPGGDLIFDPDSVEILPGTTVVWEWDSDTHNVEPESQPDGADWAGETDIYNTGHTYQHTFTVEGTYAYFCRPHRASGMEGEIVVTEDAGGGAGGGGSYEPPDPAHMGIPVQKHFVGALAFMGIFVTLVFTFYLLKYGESAHTAAPSKED